MSSSWLKVSCVALGSAIALSALTAAAAPTTHFSFKSGLTNVPGAVPPIPRMANVPGAVPPIPRMA